MRQSEREQHASHHAQDGNHDLQVPQENLKLMVSHTDRPRRPFSMAANGSESRGPV
jgi:hypothetical protein